MIRRMPITSRWRKIPIKTKRGSKKKGTKKTKIRLRTKRKNRKTKKNRNYIKLQQ